MSKKPGSAFGAFAQQKPVQSQDEIAEEARKAARASQSEQSPQPAGGAKRKPAGRSIEVVGQVSKLTVRLDKADRDRLKEFNLAPYNMSFQQLVVTALNYYLEHKMGQKGRPLQTPASYK